MTGGQTVGLSASRRLGGSMLAAALGIVILATGLQAQDTVRVGITYHPGVRPGIVILPAPGLDSVKAIVERDLDYSDRFEVIALSQLPAGEGSSRSQPVNYAFYRTLGAAYAVELTSAPGSATALRLHDLATERVRNELLISLDRSGVGEGRMSVHHLSDEIVRLITGQSGIASTRLLFLNHDDKRIWRVDSDGANQTPVTPAGVLAMSPAWSPDASRFVYTQFNSDGTKPVVVQEWATGRRTTVAGTAGAQYLTPMFSPDGRQLIFARMGEDGVALYSANAQTLCCLERLTGGRFAENFSPAYSPDGRRVVFVSTRAGGQQIYSMASDGADQSLLIPFDYGSTGNSNAPEWSPDGTAVVFHREVGGVPQVFVFDLAGRSLRQLTSLSRNEDPSWAPDGRHIVFVSHRTGRRQLFVVDLETSRVRQIMTPVTARLPAWSRTLGSSR
jgi:TolB protein